MNLESDCIYTAELPGCGLTASSYEKESKTEFYSCDTSYSKEYLEVTRTLSLTVPDIEDPVYEMNFFGRVQ